MSGSAEKLIKLFMLYAIRMGRRCRPRLSCPELRRPESSVGTWLSAVNRVSLRVRPDGDGLGVFEPGLPAKRRSTRSSTAGSNSTLRTGIPARAGAAATAHAASASASKRLHERPARMRRLSCTLWLRCAAQILRGCEASHTRSWRTEAWREKKAWREPWQACARAGLSASSHSHWWAVQIHG